MTENEGPTQDAIEETAREGKKLAYVALSLIEESEVALRSVDRKAEDYLQLAQSIASNGVLEPILVRELDKAGATFYGLINGLQRYSAAKDAGLTEIPAHIVNISEGDLMEAQIITNLHRVETKPAQYSTQLRRLISADPMLTMKDLAEKLATSVKWLNDRLSLTKLHKEIQVLVDTDELKLANAYALAKLPIDEQKDFLSRAMSDKSNEFTAVVAQRVKEIKDARREGREPRKQEFVAVERAQSLSDLKAERSSGSIGVSVLKQANAKSAQDGWKACLDWVLRMDEISVKEQKSKYEQKKKEREESRERAKVERDKRQRDAAAVKQEDLMAL